MLKSKGSQVTKQTNVEQINLREQKNNLKKLKSIVRGHYERIEKISGCTKGAVSAILSGTYKGAVETKERVLIAAKEVAEQVEKSRQEAEQRLAKILS